MLAPTYPSTRHIEGSVGLVAGPSRVPLATLAGCCLAVEEKLDGDMIGLGFDGDARMRMVNHGALIDGADPRFRSAWTWAGAREDALFDRLGGRYWLYGEAMAWTHSVFYDRLPAVVLEYDIWDGAAGVWLDTPSRCALLKGLDVVPVPLLWRGPMASSSALAGLVRPSAFRSPSWRDALAEAAMRAGADGETLAALAAVDGPEGLYIKVEKDGCVLARYKWIDPGFAAGIRAAGGHWRSRVRISNGAAQCWQKEPDYVPAPHS